MEVLTIPCNQTVGMKMYKTALLFMFCLNWLNQEGLAAAFGNGLSTACIVNMGAQVTSVICVEVRKLYFCLSIWLKSYS